MNKLLIFGLLLGFYSAIAADAIKKVDLEYRDAETTRSLLQALFKDDIAIVVDGNSLLIRGQNSDIQALTTMIKRLDKPQKSLQVTLYRGVDPYQGDIDKHSRRTATTYPHQDNLLDQWLMEDGTTVVLRDNSRVLKQEEQLLLETDGDQSKALFSANSTSQETQTKQHELTITLTDTQQSARLRVKTLLANRAATGGDDELLSTEVERRRIIPTGEWTRLFYRQSQANTFTPENRSTATTALTFKDEQSLWILVEPLLSD